jgi:acylphosphatase
MVMTMPRIRKHLLLSGRVQGVWFRESTRRHADRLGVDGWVRNLPDGRVEVVFEGPPELVSAAVEWARSGPPHARVDDVSIEDEAPLSTKGFEVR